VWVQVPLLAIRRRNRFSAEVAQLVERHLAKVDVAGSNPVFRYIIKNKGAHYARLYLQKKEFLMDVFIKEYTDCLRQAFVNFNSDEVNKEYDEALASLQKKSQFPGYRAGKVPFDIIEKNSSDELMKLIVNSMVIKAADKLFHDGVHLYTEPRFKPLTNLSKSHAFSFSMIFDVVPKVLKNVDLESAVIEFEEFYYDDKMMDYSIQKELKILDTVTGKIEEGDTVTAKVITPKIDNSEEYTFDSGVVKPLIGRKSGDKLTLKFAELDFHVVDFLGKSDGSVEIEVVKVERPSIQAVTDDLIRQVSPYKTVDDYRKALKTRFDNMEKEFNHMAKKRALMSHISLNARVEFPKSDYIRDARREIVQFIENNFYVTEISLNDLLDDKKVKDEFLGLPEKIKENIVFFVATKEIADQNSIEPSKEAIDKIAVSHAKEHGLTLDEYKQKASKEEWGFITEMAKIDTALDFLMEKVRFKAKSRQPIVKIK
jgi:trigger factor